MIAAYQELRVWQVGMDIADASYRLTKPFPREELFAMTSQIRRAASSIPANIAEGYGRNNPGDYHRFLCIAMGSLKELETHPLLAVRVELTTAEAVAPILASCDEEGRMLQSLMRQVANRRE
jgi:four helix bundle protein